MIKKYFPIGIVLLILLVLTSCYSSNNGTGVSGEKSTVNNEASGQQNAGTADPKNDKANSANSFKLPVEGTRPIAVMIDNEGTRSLPQGGLDKAQLIYEIIVEGGETRLMPVFWDTDPQMIGSVRSSRHYFLDYAMEHDAIYVHFGWSPMAQKDISKFKINNINGISSAGSIFWDLTKDRRNWQDSYTSMKNILEYVKKVKYRTKTDKKLVFSYNQTDAEPASDQKAEKISIRYSYTYICSYEYDPAAKAYKRFRKGKPQMERVSGSQLEAANIIIQYTPDYDIKGDDKGRQDVKTAGSGKGYFITCGKAIKIKWSKESRSSQTKYTDEAGNTILLNPGQTWIQVLPLSGKVSIQ